MELWKYGAIVLTAIESARSFYINVGYERNEALLKDGGDKHHLHTMLYTIIYLILLKSLFKPRFERNRRRRPSSFKCTIH